MNIGKIGLVLLFLTQYLRFTSVITITRKYPALALQM